MSQTQLPGDTREAWGAPEQFGAEAGQNSAGAEGGPDNGPHGLEFRKRFLERTMT